MNMNKEVKRCTTVFAVGFGVPDGIRTHDTRIKSPVLYRAELRAHICAPLFQGEAERKSRKDGHPVRADNPFRVYVQSNHPMSDYSVFDDCFLMSFWYFVHISISQNE